MAIAANANRMWIRPPKVNEVTIPKNHKTSSTTQIVQSIVTSIASSHAGWKLRRLVEPGKLICEAALLHFPRTISS
jgi:hypothetical protein